MEDMRDLREKRKHIMHPHEEANFLSRLFFCWLIPTFVTGYKRDLNEEDLHGHMKIHESGALGDKFERAWLDELRTKKEPSLIKAIWKVFKFEICINGLLLFIIELGTKLAQPLCLSKLMDFYVPNQSSVSKSEAYLYASIIVLAAFFNAILGHHLMLRNQHLGMKIRVAGCSLIYRKSLRLSKTALINTTVGQMINLLSNDVNRFDTTFMHFHNFWVAPLQIIVITSLIYVMCGVYALAGVGFFVIFIPLQMVLGKKSSKFRMKIAIKTDERVRLMNEIICAVRVIKMYTWEKPFVKLVEHARKLEMQLIRSTSFIRAIHSSFAMFLNRTAIFLCVLTYTFFGHTPQAYYVFVVTSLLNVIRQSMVVHVPHAISSLAEAFISVKRIEEFLMREEIRPRRIGSDFKNDISSINVDRPAIFMQGICAKWDSSSNDDTLSIANFKVGSNELVAVIGTVGSGKTSLFHVILNELPISKGSLEVNGTISYASQEPWIFPGTIKENILFGGDMNQDRYSKACRVCELETDFSVLPNGDKTMVGERGVTLSGGQKARVGLARAIYRDADIYLLDDPLSAVDTRVGKEIFGNCILEYLKNKCVILVTHQLQYLRMVDRIYVLKNGTFNISGTFDELHTIGDEFKAMLEEDQDDKSSSEESLGTNETDVSKDVSEIKEYRQAGAIENYVYKGYIKAGGGYFMGILVISLFIFTQFSASFADYFLTYWVNMEQKKATLGPDYYNSQIETNIFLKTNNCVYFYTSLVCFIITVAFIRSITFMDFCMVASRNLHNRMFSSIINTSMRFFEVNPSGRILNRFSKDMGSIDEILPLVILDTLQIFLSVIFITILVAIVNPWYLIPSCIILVIFYGLKLVFLASSRSIKRMEATSRSPVFTQMTISMQGLTTIRAFGVQESLKKIFDSQQNMHSSPFYMFMTCNRAFGFWLDLHCVIYIGLVTMGFLVLENETYGGNVGLAITQSLSLTGMFQWGMRQWSELENQMTSVERVAEYADLKPEPDAYVENVPNDWPLEGCLKIDHVSLRYSTEEPYVLNDVSFTIQPMEKVGIVGRTGAGKSSITSALFRLAEIEGNVYIDDVNTKTISLQTLRSKMSIIPQEPVLFSGTLRRNLDPFDQYEDYQLWQALKEVELERLTHELPSGLNSKVSEGGSNFSLGERQLICLARAIVRNNKILVLDEATASVDHETDILIQRTIREKFQHCTVLTIAHRLNTVMDSNKILVMDAGMVVEFDHPYILLQRDDSWLSRLVHQTGKSMTLTLTKIAEESYKQQTSNRS